MSSWAHNSHRETTMYVKWNIWRQRFEATLQACMRLNGNCREMVVAKPATAQQVELIELKLNRSLPASFRKVLMDFSSHVEVTWFLPHDLELPDTFRGIFCGDCRWDIMRLLDLEEGRQDWVKQCFPNIDDPYDRIWHNKLAFQDVGNGDMLSLDLNFDDSPIVYLSHEGGDFHGTVLGENFIDFVDRWSLLGFVGAEDWQLEKFVSSRTGGLEPYSDNANKWREWFGLKVSLS